MSSIHTKESELYFNKVIDVKGQKLRKMSLIHKRIRIIF